MHLFDTNEQIISSFVTTWRYRDPDVITSDFINPFSLLRWIIHQHLHRQTQTRARALVHAQKERDSPRLNRALSNSLSLSRSLSSENFSFANAAENRTLRKLSLTH